MKKSAYIGIVIHRSLLSQLFSPEDMVRLHSLGTVRITSSETPISMEAACGILESCNVGIGSWSTPYPCAEMLDCCPSLRLWEHAAGSVKHMFGPHLDGHKLCIASCKTAIAEDVAEFTVGEIICGVRGIAASARANRCGVAPKPPGLRVLSRCVVGVVGASEVGRRVVHRLKPFGCSVLVYDPYLTPAAATDLGVEVAGDLTEMCARCDVVTVHTPAISACRNIIGARQLRAMRDDAILINTSRGICVDEAALLLELERGRLFAFLDVSDPEPPAEQSPLRALPNVVYTSHIAGPPSHNIGKQAVDDVEAFLNGGRPLCVVTADQLETTA